MEKVIERVRIVTLVIREKTIVILLFGAYNSDNTKV